MADFRAENLKTTPLYDRHVAAGGRMVPFGGYALPVQYPTGIMAEHKWTREHAGLFDVSHMGPSFLDARPHPSGDAEADHAAIAAIIEPLICGDMQGLKPGQVRYTLLLNENGGAIDDLMVARSPLLAGSLYIVVNAGTKDDDFAPHRRGRRRQCQAAPAPTMARCWRCRGPRPSMSSARAGPGGLPTGLHDLWPLRLARHQR